MMKLVNSLLTLAMPALAWTAAVAGETRCASVSAAPGTCHESQALERRQCGAYAIPDSPITVADFPETPIRFDHTVHVYGQTSSKSVAFLPSSGGEVPASRVPLAIVLHGRHYDFDEYTDIQKRLAANGIASVSIQYSEHHHDSDFEETAFYSVLEKNLRSIYDYVDGEQSPLYGRVRRQVSIIGHSMGGGLAVYAANRLVEEDRFGLEIRSVVALAPNPQTDKDWIVDPRVSRSLLVLLGSNDPDSGVNAPGNSGFDLYDRSGHLQNEFSNALIKNAFVKSMVYLRDGDHDIYTDTGDATMKTSAIAYITAFSRWSLLSDQDYGVYFNRQAPVDQGVTTSLLHSDPFRRVLDNFEDAPVGTNSLGGMNIFENLDVVQKFSLFDQGSPHATDVVQLRWDAAAIGTARFSIPPPFQNAEDYRDVSKYAFLSFRAGRMYEPDLKETDLDFRIRMDYFDGGGHASQIVNLSDMGEVPFSLAHMQASKTKSAMNTVRIPLCLFDRIDFDHALVTAVGFEFSSPGSERGAIQIDSLEFVR